jgi:hypothetical protein
MNRLDSSADQQVGFYDSHEIMPRVHYVDHLERRDGQWKIAGRRVVFDPSSISVAAEFPRDGALLDGADNDPSYAW